MNCPCCNADLVADQSKPTMLAHLAEETPLLRPCPLTGDYRHGDDWQTLARAIAYVLAVQSYRSIRRAS